MTYFRLHNNKGYVINHITFMKLYRLGTIECSNVCGGLDIYYMSYEEGSDTSCNAHKVNRYLRCHY